MEGSRVKQIFGAAVVACLTGGFACQASAEEIAGVEPSLRPAGAPVITTVDHGEAWYANALRGISAPIPESLGFLEDEGVWYTPFIHPNVPGRYDIRGLYGAPGETAN
ncbi:MAG: hypothetical protein KDG54_17810 [Geminicoccaceae bacterium]|nr:hypothetical protein [Geminicoccaceae bacterium]